MSKDVSTNNTDDFYEDDDLYYDELEYEDYENYDTEVPSIDEAKKDETVVYDTYETLEYDRDDYGEYDNSAYTYDNSYEEDNYQEKHKFGNNIKKILLVILLILFIFVLFLFFKSTRNNKKTSNLSDNIKIINKVNNNYNDIFNKMKNSSLVYFTKEHIDNNDAEISLGQMQELNIIDNVDSKYDINKSKSTLKDNILKIEVFDGNKAKTKTYVVGNYIYCKDTYYCVRSTDFENKSYEYEKEGEKQIHEWSDWSEYVETSCDTSEVECDIDDASCLKEIKTNYKYNYDSKNMIYQVARNAFSTTNKEVLSVCNNFDYVKINNAYYRTEKNANFKVLGLITKNTQSDYYNWKYNGRNKYHNPPSDTINTRYVFVEADYSNCGDSCSDHPDYYYDSYTFTKSLVNVSNVVSDCNTYTTKVVPNYIIENQKITVSREENNDTKICYMSSRERTVTQDDKIIKWSNYNNKELLSEGYNYTGNFK